MPDNQWQECPAGLVMGMARRLRSQRRREQLQPIGVAVVALLVFVVGYISTSQYSSTGPGGLTCTKASTMFAEYHDQTLDRASSQKVEAHLAGCPHCSEHFRRMYPGEAREEAELGNLVALAIGTR